MQYEIDNSNLTVDITNAEINVAVGNVAALDIGTAVTYIRTGQEEIAAAVNAGISEFNANAQNKMDIYNANAAGINTVAANITGVNTAAANIAVIDTVAGINHDVSAVASASAAVATVADNITTIAALSDAAPNLAAVGNNLTEIATVADNTANINAVAALDDEVTAVAGNIAAVSTVAADSSNIAACVANLTAINAAPDYADRAQKWAEGTPAAVQALGGTASAKDWAQSDEVLMVEPEIRRVNHLYAWKKNYTTPAEYMYLAEDLPVPTEYAYIYDINMPIYVYNADGSVITSEVDGNTYYWQVLIAMNGFYLFGYMVGNATHTALAYRAADQDITSAVDITYYKRVFSTQKESLACYTYMQNSKENLNRSLVAADHSNIWAEGTDAQVTALGGEHSAKEWAAIAATSAEHSSDKTFVYEQATATDVWVIDHNLAKYPSVTVADSAGNIFYPAVKYNNENRCTVMMNGATTGKAFLN